MPRVGTKHDLAVAGGHTRSTLGSIVYGIRYWGANYSSCDCFPRTRAPETYFARARPRALYHNLMPPLVMGSLELLRIKLGQG
jgi:hypothetical protein